MKNVLIYIPKLYHGGGGERSSLALGSALSGDYNVSFLTQHRGDIIENPEPIYCLNQKEKTLWKILDFIPTAWKLRHYCRKNNVDIVISNMARANTITMLAKYLFGNTTKNILITRNANSGKKIHDLWMKLWGGAERNIAVSYGAEYVLKNKGLENTQTIYNAYDIPTIKQKLERAIEPEHEHLFEKQGPVFLNIGRLHKQKAQSSLIKAFAELVETETNAQLLIAGEGEERTNLEDLIAKYSLEQNVTLLGNIQNVFPYIRKSDCFVLSSNWEGLPTVVVESVISEKYIISTDCMSGPREILTDKAYGEDLTYPYVSSLGTLISPPADNEESFIRGFVIASKTFLQEKPEPNKTDISIYSYEAIRSGWVELIESL